MLSSFSVALLIILVALAVLIPRQVEHYLRDLVYNHARSVAREIAAQVPPDSLPAAGTAVSNVKELELSEAQQILAAAVFIESPGSERPVLYARRPSDSPSRLATLAQELNWGGGTKELSDGNVAAAVSLPT